MDCDQSGLLPVGQKSPLLKRILQESREYRRKPQQKHYRAPDFPGTAAFDLRNGFNEIPCAKRKRTAPLPSSLAPVHIDDGPTFSEDELLKMSPDDYHRVITQELDRIEQVSRSGTLSPSPYVFHNNDLENWGSTLSEGVAEPLGSDQTYSSSTPFDDANLPSPPQLGIERLDAVPSGLESGIEIPTKPLLGRPVTEQQLIKEVKDIYAGLITAERKCIEAVVDESKSSKRLSNERWKALIALHRSLLSEHHDFFLATQHPSASVPLTALAMKYAMPKHMWRESMYQFLELLRRRSPEFERHMGVFGNLCAETMQKFTEHMPQLSQEWDLIKDNLKDYFTALRADGIKIPPSLINRFETRETVWTRLRKMWFPPMQGHFFGDDELPAWFVESYLPDRGQGLLDEPDNGIFGTDDLQGTAQLIMTGWLQYGRKIATSYHVFCQVAIFLAVIVFTASIAS